MREHHKQAMSDFEDYLSEVAERAMVEASLEGRTTLPDACPEIYAVTLEAAASQIRANPAAVFLFGKVTERVLRRLLEAAGEVLKEMMEKEEEK